MDVSLEITGLIGAVMAAWTLPWKISRDIRKEREAEASRLLQAAKEADSKIKAELEAKIRLFEEKLKNLQHDIDKDLFHIKETYNGALANLGQKIEDLRDELRQHHTNLLSLLTKMASEK